MKYIYGIDIGGTSVKIGLFSTNGNLIHKWQIPTNTSDSGKHIASDIFESIKNYNIPLQDVIGYGFGVPGPVVHNRVIQCVNLGWKDYDFYSEFSEFVNNENIIIQNDANVAALGEWFKGAAEGYENAVMITLGTGVGGGIITNGTPVEGGFGCGGEIGHMVVKQDGGRLCNCGNHGCLETLVSATGIKKEYLAMAEELGLEPTLLHNGRVSAKEVFDQAEQGDELSFRVIDRVAYYLGYACHIISVVTNPDIILFGGGVSRAGSFLLDKVEREFRNYKFTPAQGIKLAIAELGNDAGMYGAASLIIVD